MNQAVLGRDLGSFLTDGSHGSISIHSSRSASFPSGYRIIKTVIAAANGETPDRRPHNVSHEIEILQRVDHPNIATLLRNAYDGDTFEWRLELPLYACTLTDILPTSPSFIIFKSIALQLSAAISYLHDQDIAHRDIKPDNIMLDWDGCVKLIDLGTAWKPEWEAQGEMECSVGTGPYRAPELLFGPTTYDAKAIDLWAVGCVFTEFFNPRVPILDEPDDSDTESGSSEDPLEDLPLRSTLFDSTFGDIGLAASIFRVCGSPDAQRWPAFKDLPDAAKVEFVPFQPIPLSDILDLTIAGVERGHVLDFLGRILCLDPATRLNATASMRHPMFKLPVLVPGHYCERLSSSLNRNINSGYSLKEEIDGLSLELLLERPLNSARQRSQAFLQQRSNSW